MRTIIIESPKLDEILRERAIIFKEARAINQEMDELDKSRKKCGYKMDKLKDKTAAIIKKENIELGEFEVITNVYIDEKTHKTSADIVDQIEEYTVLLREKITNEKKSNEPS